MAAAKKAAPKAKPGAKKTSAKPVAKKAAGKTSAKPVAKKAAGKTSAAAAKKAATKKTVAKKAPAKKAAPKATSKPTPKPSSKSTAKPTPKAVAKKTAPKAATKQTPSKNVNSKPAPEKAASQGSLSPTQRQGMTSAPKASSKKASKKEKRMDSLFEATQAAPKSIAPKVDDIPPTPATPTVFTTPEPVKPKPNVRYSDKELKEFAKVIESEKEKTLEELRMLKERLEDLTNYEASEETAVYSMHMAEQGSEAVEREKTYAQIQRTTDYLRKLDESMKRIEDKTYGICRQCGILIARERLLAVPITTLSASWKLRQRCPDDGVDRIGK